MRVFGREPALWISTVAALLAVVGGFGVPALDDGVIAAITAFLTAGAAAFTALHVRPVAPAVFTGAITTGATLLAAFGLDLDQHHVALVSAASIAVMTLIFRQQVTPNDDPSNSVTGAER
jgi:hypothetical protein